MADQPNRKAVPSRLAATDRDLLRHNCWDREYLLETESQANTELAAMNLPRLLPPVVSLSGPAANSPGGKRLKGNAAWIGSFWFASTCATRSSGSTDCYHYLIALPYGFNENHLHAGRGVG
jgi:hypothetical protein